MSQTQTATVTLVPLSALAPSPTNPRQSFDEHKLAELANSIKSHGVLQPLVVRKLPKNGKYEVVAGERRFRAAKLAKLETVPAIVRELSDQDAIEIQIIENSQRDDVHPLDEAEGFAKLMQLDPQKYTADAIAEKIGKSKSHVYQRLKLNDLVPKAKEALRKGAIEAGHAILLARLAPAVQEAVAKQVNNETSVRSLARYISEHVYIDLHSAPFPKAEPFRTLTNVEHPAQTVEKGNKVSGGKRDKTGHQTIYTLPACTTCPLRTGSIPHLWADVQKGDHCTYRPCFDEKHVLFLRKRQEELATEIGTPVPLAVLGYVHNLPEPLKEGSVHLSTYEYSTEPRPVPDGARIFGQRQKAEAVLADTEATPKMKKEAKATLDKLPVVRPALLVGRERHADKEVAHLKAGDVVYMAEARTKVDARTGMKRVTGLKSGEATLQAKIANAKKRLEHRIRVAAAQQIVMKAKHPLPLPALELVAKVLAQNTGGHSGAGKIHSDVPDVLHDAINPLKALGIKGLSGLHNAKPNLIAKALVRYAIQDPVESEWGGEHGTALVKAMGDVFDVDWKAAAAIAMEQATPHDKRVLAAKLETRKEKKPNGKGKAAKAARKH